MLDFLFLSDVSVGFTAAAVLCTCTTLVLLYTYTAGK